MVVLGNAFAAVVLTASRTASDRLAPEMVETPLKSEILYHDINGRCLEAALDWWSRALRYWECLRMQPAQA